MPYSEREIKALIVAERREGYRKSRYYTEKANPKLARVGKVPEINRYPKGRDQ